tara:strand:- start:8133 stop:8918 length:786 start_codon:yes stop_codon:yes gene_type:complete
MLGLGSSLVYESGLSPFNNYSLVFDGDGDYLELDNTFSQAHGGNFTWSLWVKPEDGRPSAVTTLLGSTNNRDADSFAISIVTSGKLLFNFHSDGYPDTGDTDAVIFDDGIIPTFTHICFSAEKDAGGGQTVYKLYVNGVATDWTNITTHSVNKARHEAWDSDFNIYVGGKNSEDTLANPFSGFIDEVAIWSEALSDANVAKMYNDGVPFDLTKDNGNYDNSNTLIGYWRMEEGAGTSVEDLGSLGNNGSLEGDTEFKNVVP